MTQQECDKAKQEYWEEFKQLGGQGWESKKYIFDFAFDRAYALGKEDISAKPTESKSIQLSDVKAKIDAWMENHTDEEVYECLKKYGAVEDVDTVIQGWVARDKRDNALLLHAGEPYRTWSGYQMDARQDVWENDFASFLPLDSKLFHDLTWDSDPIEVELIIKRKNNGNIQ